MGVFARGRVGMELLKLNLPDGCGQMYRCNVLASGMAVMKLYWVGWEW